MASQCFGSEWLVGGSHEQSNIQAYTEQVFFSDLCNAWRHVSPVRVERLLIWFLVTQSFRLWTWASQTALTRASGNLWLLPPPTRPMGPRTDMPYTRHVSPRGPYPWAPETYMSLLCQCQVSNTQKNIKHGRQLRPGRMAKNGETYMWQCPAAVWP